MKKTSTCSVAIHSRNRLQSVLVCLESIKKQTVLPNELIFIENVIENTYFSYNKINAFFDNKVHCVYRTVHVNSRAVSRNMSMEMSTGDIYISIDHDAYLANPYIFEYVIRLHSRYKDVAGFVGPVNPIGSSPYSLFSSVLYYPELIKGEMGDLRFYPSTFFSLKMEKINTYTLRFNTASNAEDIDFFWRLTNLGERLAYSSKLPVFAEFPENMMNFLKKRYSYALNNADLFVTSDGDVDTVSWLFLNRKIKLILYPLFFVYHLLMGAHETIRNKRISYKYAFLSLMNEWIIAIGFFSSETGRKLFIDRLLKTIA